MKSSAVSRVELFLMLMAISPFVNSLRSAEETMRFAAIIHRHGDRSPFLAPYPNDPHINYKWPGGRGALSSIGSLQMYALGKTLRKRYGRLLPSDGIYTAEKMHVMSSALERTQMSGQSLLAGLMPPLSDRNALPIQWQPVPIHSIPKQVDNLIAQDAPCPKFDEIHAEILKNPPSELQRIYQENAELYSYLTENSGLNETFPKVVGKLWDTLFVQHTNNLPLPAWALSVFPDRLRPFAELIFALHTYTKHMQLVKGGPLVTKITNQMLKSQSGRSSRTVYVYSGHDLTLLSVIRLLDLTNQTTRIPEYGAALAFELHCAKEEKCNQLEVRIVYYFSFDDKQPTQLTIPNCPAPCMLNQFVKSIEFILDFDYEESCKLEKLN